MDNTIIRIEGLVKNYGELKVLKGLNLKIKRGENRDKYYTMVFIYKYKCIFNTGENSPVWPQ